MAASGKASPYPPEELEVARRVAPAVHGLEDARGGVLEGQVEIGHEAGIGGHDAQHGLGEVVRVDVEGADPEVAIDRRERGQELGQAGSLRGAWRGRETARGSEVAPVGTQVLADEDELLDTLREEVEAFGEDLALGAGAQGAANQGDGAEGAEVGAALGGLDVGRSGKVEAPEPPDPAEGGRGLGYQHRALARERRLGGREHGAEVGVPDDAVGLRKIGGEVGGVALGQAAGHEDALAGIGGLDAATASMDSLFASSTKPQVLTMMRSAPPGPSTNSWPAASRRAAISSPSTSFFAQPWRSIQKRMAPVSPRLRRRGSSRRCLPGPMRCA